VGQGDATVVLGPQAGTAILVDAAKPEPVLDLLWREEVHTITLALVTHDDHDHIHGFGPVLRTFVDRGGRVQHVAIDQSRLNASTEYKRLLRMLSELTESGTILCCPTTDSITLKALLESQRIGHLLYPTPRDLQLAARLAGHPNEGSAVLLLEWGGRRVLLGADLGEPGWRKLIRDDHRNIRADVFRFPHHGAPFPVPDPKTDTLAEEDLLNAVDPSVVIISVGTANSYGHPDPLVIHAIRKRRKGGTVVRLLCTEANYLCVEPGGEPFRAKPRSPIRCAGAIAVELTSDRLAVKPANDQHEAVFSSFGGTLRCRPASR
jgi:competence protein ComEC